MIRVKFNYNNLYYRNQVQKKNNNLKETVLHIKISRKEIKWKFR